MLLTLNKNYFTLHIVYLSKQRSWHNDSPIYHSLLRMLLIVKVCGELNYSHWGFSYCIPVNPPPFCGSFPRKSLISRMDWVSCAGDINLPHDLPPTKKSSTIKSWPTFCDQYFWKFPIWNSRADEKCREIRMVKVFKWYPVIDLFDTFTGKLGHGD
jgi:hypothetical protein